MTPLLIRGIRLALTDALLLACTLFLTRSPQPAASNRLPPTLPYAARIQETAVRHHIDPALLAAVVQVESAFNPTAVSPAGAIGLAQLMPATAAACQLTDPFDPAQNLACAAWLLADLRGKYDLPLALAAYNAGETAVLACGCIPANGETELYVPRVLAAYEGTLTRLMARNPLPGEDILSLFPVLYGHQTYVLTNPAPHGLPGWEGYDGSAGCGAPLYAPVSGIVTYNGPDGYVGLHGGPSSLLVIQPDGGETAVSAGAGLSTAANAVQALLPGSGPAVLLLHGSYLPAVGSRVVAGQTLIGVEAAVGNATGCHTHLGVTQWRGERRE